MPNFNSPFSILDSERDLNDDEILRALRMFVGAEFEAIQTYQQVANAIKDPLIKKAILSIVEEETVHAGEFLKMIAYLRPEEPKLYAEGAAEVQDLIDEHKQIKKLVDEHNKNKEKATIKIEIENKQLTP